jgi:hypothetical protein
MKRVVKKLALRDSCGRQTDLWRFGLLTRLLAGQFGTGTPAGR